MDKRGDTTPLLMLFEILGAVIILIAMISIAKKVATGESIRQEFLTKDTALVIDTLHSVPGDVEFIYQTGNYSDELKLDLLLDHSLQLIGPFGSKILSPFRAGMPQVTTQGVTIPKNTGIDILFTKKASVISFGLKENEETK